MADAFEDYDFVRFQLRTLPNFIIHSSALLASRRASDDDIPSALSPVLPILCIIGQFIAPLSDPYVNKVSVHIGETPAA